MNKFIKIKERLKELIENQYLIIDGATGTELQKKEIKKEEWIIRASQLRMTEHIKTEQLIGLERRREEIYSEMQ